MFKNFTVREQKQNELKWWYEQKMKDDKRDPKWSKKVHESINKLENELLNDVRNDTTEHTPNQDKRFRFSWKSIWRKITGLVRR